MTHASKVSRQAIQKYNEMIQDTAYNLQVHIQRIDEKMAPFTTNTISDLNIDLEDERVVAKQCLQICEEARLYTGPFINRELALLREAPGNATENERQPF